MTANIRPFHEKGRRFQGMLVALGSRYVFTSLAIIIMGFSGFLSLHSSWQMRGAVSNMLEIQKRREAAQSFVSYLKDTERGQRGFVLTGDESYLQPYVVGKSSAIQMLTRLRQLHEGDSSWMDTLDYVQQRANAKFVEMDDSIRVRREEGLLAAAAMIKTNEGKRLMEDINLTLLQMVTRESNILSIDNFNYRSVMTEAIVGFSVSNILVLSLMVVTLLMIESRRKMLMEQTRIKSGIAKEISELNAIELGEVTGNDALARLKAVQRNLAGVVEHTEL